MRSEQGDRPRTQMRPVAARYVYLGAYGTAAHLVGARCDPIRRADGRCIVGRGQALVVFEGESLARVVVRRRLRLTAGDTLKNGTSGRASVPAGAHVSKDVAEHRAAGLCREGNCPGAWPPSSGTPRPAAT
jgi:hypothetical protein